MSRFLEGKVAIVTGSGRGIGQAIAEEFADWGAKVTVLDIDADVAEAVAEGIKARGGQAIAVRCDVTSREQIQAMVERTLAEFGTIDCLVNNAGILRPAMLHKMTDEQWDLVHDVHLKGAWRCIQAVAPTLMAKQSGKIINIISGAGITGSVGQCNYAAAKAGLIALTKSAARELARYNILCNAVGAGVVVTRMTETIRQDERFADQYKQRVLLGRWGEPQEIAPMVAFMASEKTTYMTGQVVLVDGGIIV